MSTLPLDKLGPGQSGRSTYLVFGKDGPVHNPDNIRHLPLDSPEIPANSSPHQHTAEPSADGKAIVVAGALCAAPFPIVAAFGIGVGLGAGICWLLSKKESTSPTPVEETPEEASPTPPVIVPLLPIQ